MMATGLTPERADAARSRTLTRRPWVIENQVHRAQDVHLGEDASRIHPRQEPYVRALLSDAALAILHRAGVRQIDARLRPHRRHHPESAVALVVGSPTTHA
jgi:hypothetical protein